jgi:serine/threonine protein kinase
MTLSPGFRLGPYEILSLLGAGGMGEVYRARDTRLERDVAVKVLSAHLSSSPELRQRFEREAKAISALSHPHVCAIYDVGNQDGVEYLVMEYLEGESLAERLENGSLSVDQTLRWGEEVAAALDAAHRHGIVHRDLKPGNVMLTKSGVKLLDFGLAKLLRPPGPVGGLTSAPTEAKDLTSEGTILGTVAYMAPEQIEGKSADQRTDIFALGAVLYEMATGRKPFTGESRVSLIGSILKDEPALISSIRPMTPPALDRIVRTCLAKDPDDRFQAAHDVKLQLRWIAEEDSRATAPPALVSTRKSRERVAWALAALMTFALAASLLSRLSASREPLRAVRTSILPPEKSAFVFDAGAMALSPDGTRLAFIATSPHGKNLLWVRQLNSMSAQSLAGTQDASFPFWSPDSRHLGFFAAGTLKTIDISGGPAQTLCIARNGRGGAWDRDGVIVFSPSGRGSLMRVTATGGTPVPVGELDPSKGEFSHRFPFFLPDGRHYLYLAVAGTGSDTVYVGTLDSKERKFLVRVNSNAIYAPPPAESSRGYLLFSRQRTVVAQPFDAKGLSLIGEAVPIGESVSFFDNTGLAAFTASNTGAFAYQSGGVAALSQLTWFDRTGKQLDVVGAPADYRRVRLSHDGRRVAGRHL